MKAHVSEMRQLGVMELRDKIAEREKELFALRSQSRTLQVEKPHRFRELRRDIARYRTVLREKESSHDNAK